MEFINKNLKKVSIFNTVLIVITIVLLAIQIATSSFTSKKIESILQIVALLYGLYYALTGYKKISAIGYKVFMIIYALCSVTPLFRSTDIFTIIISVLETGCALLLAFGKNLGKSISTTLACVILILAITKIVRSALVLFSALNYVTVVSGLLLAFIVLVFVSTKYADKASRGTK